MIDFGSILDAKLGAKSIQNGNKKMRWKKDEEKEKKYLQDLKSFHERSKRSKEVEEVEGVVVKRRKTSHEVSRDCPVCGAYSFSSQDDLYMTKFGCCFNCYIQYIEGREERWKTGWRPNN